MSKYSSSRCKTLYATHVGSHFSLPVLFTTSFSPLPQPHSLPKRAPLQVALAWLVLPRTHAQKVILAQHFPQLLGRILSLTSSNVHPSGGPTDTPPAIPDLSRAAKAPQVLATTTSKGLSTQRRGVTSCLQPHDWRLLSWTLQQGLARRGALLTHMRQQAAKCAGRTAQPQPRQRLRLPERMQRVELAALAQRSRQELPASGKRAPRSSSVRSGVKVSRVKKVNV